MQPCWMACIASCRNNVLLGAPQLPTCGLRLLPGQSCCPRSNTLFEECHIACKAYRLIRQRDFTTRLVSAHLGVNWPEVDKFSTQCAQARAYQARHIARRYTQGSEISRTDCSKWPGRACADVEPCDRAFKAVWCIDINAFAVL